MDFKKMWYQLKGTMLDGTAEVKRYEISKYDAMETLKLMDRMETENVLRQTEGANDESNIETP